MSASLNYRAAESRDGVRYVADVSVIDASEIPTELFVFRLDGETFSHVATLLDLATYPPSIAEAQAVGQPFYRSSAMRYVAANPSDAREARDHVVLRLRALVTAFKASMPSNFGVTVEESIT